MSKKFLGIMLFGLAVSSQALAVKVGDVLPKAMVHDEAGKELQPWTGKKTLINFWATWCDACKVELKEMAAELKALPSDKQVVFVSLDKDPQKAKDYFAKEFKADSSMSKSLYYDSAFAMADQLGVESFPMTLVVDEAGKVLKIQDGYKPGTGSTEALFEALKSASK